METKPQINQKIELTLKGLGIHGEGVGSWQGYTLFVDGALPGEVVEARVVETKRSFGRAQTLSYRTLSPHRVTPSCPLFGKCGGCQIMHLDYAEQLVIKRQRVVDALERIGKLTGIEVLPCRGSPLPLGYRNKIQLPVISSPTGVKLGLYAYNSHDLVEIEKCPIHSTLGEEVFRQLLSLLKPFSPEELGLRYVLIKSAIHTEQALVIFVTEGEATFALRKIARALKEFCSIVRGIVQNINKTPGNTVLGKEYHVLEGEGAIEERIGGLTFKVSPASFFQVNPLQAEELYNKALELAELNGEETLLDAYCGVGTLSLLFAKRAKRVIGVECIPSAIADAKENAKKNRIMNVEFTCNDVERYISTLSAVNVALLNPPRKGCATSFLEKLSQLAPRRIVYISCDPATLARDLAYLENRGFHTETVQPFDMFPQTAHVETIVSLSHESIF